MINEGFLEALGPLDILTEYWQSMAPQLNHPPLENCWSCTVPICLWGDEGTVGNASWMFGTWYLRCMFGNPSSTCVQGIPEDWYRGWLGILIHCILYLNLLYTYIYICIYMCIYICIYIYFYVSIYVYICIYMYIYIYVYIYVYMCVYICVYIYNIP